MSGMFRLLNCLDFILPGNVRLLTSLHVVFYARVR
jgi:hypothetical protein